MAKRVRKLDDGAYAVTLQVSAEVLRFAMKQAVAGGYFGPADYLNGVLNTTMLKETEKAGEEEIDGRLPGDLL